MIVPNNHESMTEQEIIQALMDDIGYDEGAARYVAATLKGRISDDISDGLTVLGLEDYWCVCDETGIIASFYEEDDALGFIVDIHDGLSNL